MNWTCEQKSAIEKKNANILVAAAAGSGKTAVLVERIIKKIIVDKIDIDKILVVTFTNAAASEMREKILDALYKKIDENPEDLNLQKQVILLKKSNICTIHSFCLDIIKNNFFEIDISPNFRIATEEEIELIKQNCLEEVFEKYYDNEDVEFNDLLELYTNYKDDIKLKELILKIYTFIQSTPFPMQWLHESIEGLKNNLEKEFSATIWGKILLDEFEESIEDAIKVLNKAKILLEHNIELDKYLNVISSDLNTLKQLKYSKENKWDELLEKVENLNFERWPSDKRIVNELKDETKKMRDYSKKIIEEIKNKIFLFTSEEALKDIYEMALVFEKIEKIIFEFDIEFKKKKKEKNIIDFNDIEHYALEILVKNVNGEYIETDVAKRYKEKFKEIAIDEYQDSNKVQEYILSTISNGNNMFMVGDVKQSIYKFRQACPELFLEKYNKFELNNKNEFGLKIPLFKNFRSRENVINIVNNIFEMIMSDKLGDNVNYTQTEFLNKGAIFEELEQKSEICIIDLNKLENYDEEEIINLEKEEIEAKFVAQKIKKIIENNEKVTDKQTKKLRNIQYKDIVILLRSTANLSPIYEKELLDLNIPVYSESSSKYLDTIEIQSIINLLKIIDNPLNDISIVTVLRGPIYSFSDNELLEIRLANKEKSFYNSLISIEERNLSKQLIEKVRFVIDDIEYFRKYSKYSSISELIWKIYNKTGFFEYVKMLPNGNLRQANLKMLFERAKEFENTTYTGLYNFIRFLENLKESNKDLTAAKIIGENENVVRIMSIHKSKGLEFPYVFLCSTNKKINLRDLNGEVLLNQNIGLGPEYINYKRKIQYSTAAKIAMQIKTKEEVIAEEMRILYVALTRAKDKLIITATVNNYENNLSKKMQDLSVYEEDEKINKCLLKKYITYFDWIHLVYLKNNKLKNEVEFKVFNKNQIKIENNQNNEKKLIDIQIELNIEKIDKIINWEYDYKKSTLIPIKTTVSKLKQQKEDNKLNFTIPKFIEGENVSGAKIGTIIHNLLQALDLKQEYTKTILNEFIQNLVNKNKMKKEDVKFININAIINFLNSDIVKQIKNSKVLYKEMPFCMKIKADKYFDTYGDEIVLLQGIIDLFFINNEDEIILVDYKTDVNINEKILKNKYKKQLDLYADALEKYFSKKVYKKYIYSFFLNKEIEI